MIGKIAAVFVLALAASLVLAVDAPTITAISPDNGPCPGGQSVTIIGSGFTGATAVRFGGASASFTVNTDSQIAATTPAHAKGGVAVTVTAPGGTALLAAASFGASATTNFAVGNGPQSVAVGDFNGDGHLDLVVANCNSNSVSVLLGNSYGTFGAATDFDVGREPYCVAVGDFNGDGHLDLVVANYYDNSVSVLLGDGTGGFGTATNIAVGTNPISVAVGDFNGDGKLDLAVANSGSSNVSVLLGDGHGSFGSAVDFVVGYGPAFVAVADFNGDSKSDLVVALDGNYLVDPPIAGAVAVLLGDGSGSFGVATNIVVGGWPFSVAVGDFNNDGKPDLAVANSSDNNIIVLLGQGNGTFGAAINYDSGGLPAFVAAGDFNGDGKPDLVVVPYNHNYDDSYDFVSVLLNHGDGTFGAAKEFAVDYRPWAVAVGDFNGDGKSDLAVANYGSDDVSVLLGNGDGTLGPESILPVPALVQLSLVAAGDFNGDGKLDVVAASDNALGVAVWLGNGHGSFGAGIGSYVGATENAIAVGDFNGDGKLDLAVANSDDSNVRVLLGNGDGTFGAATSFGVGYGPVSVTVADFNGDGKPDLAVVYVGDSFASPRIPGGVSILLGNGDGSLGAATNFAVGTAPSAVAVGDLNGDGKPDLVLANSDAISVLLGRGDGTFGAETNYSYSRDASGGANSLAVADFNGDGKLDVAVTSKYVIVLLGNGDGTFGAAFTCGTGSAYPSSVAVGDFNGDGKPDLAVWCYGDDSVTPQIFGGTGVMLGTGYGTFSPATDFVDSGSIWAIGDFNGDGKMDLAAAWSNGIGLLWGTSGYIYRPVAAAPVITSSLAVTGRLTKGLSYWITATNGPTSFSATGLAPGLSLNATTGAIFGTPTGIGGSQHTITISATNAHGTDTAKLVLTLQLPIPVISSAMAAMASTVQPFSYQITASSSPTSFDATGLPAGLTVNTNTGVISGTPTVTGTSIKVTLSATNSGGTGNAVMYLTVSNGPIPPAIPVISSALTAAASTAQPFTYHIIASNNPTTYNASGLPSGLSIDQGTGIITGTPTKTGTFQVNLSATNTGGTGMASLVLTVSNITLTTASFKLNFAAHNMDLVTLAGTLPITASFSPDGKPVVVTIGGLSRTFTLDAKGSGGDKLKLNALKLTGKLKNGQFTGTSLKFSVKLAKQTLFSELATPGLTYDTVKNKPVSVPVTLTLDGMPYQGSKTVKYTAKAGKSGSAK